MVKHYVHINEYKQHQYMYGIMITNNDEPFTYEIDNIVGNRNDVLNMITKKIVSNKTIKDKSSIIKFDSLEDVKQINKIIKEDEFYKDINIEASPAIFMSDNDKITLLKEMVKNKIVHQRIIENNINGLKR